MLIAFPPTSIEIQRSGTWATIRYARKKNKAVMIINPDGTEQFQSIDPSIKAMGSKRGGDHLLTNKQQAAAEEMLTDSKSKERETKTQKAQKR
mmetsp:Transcript_30358/g.39138  ORF Transcript_30358/g.39138 Transcript_30358/m.39138 type:complete len:93 (+) Transcript_30358:152-430(+)